jgi:N-carbamoyl-L-amino-acid hydrolase
MPDINPTRLMGDLNHLRSIGAFKSGVHRPTYSADDMTARHWFAGRMREAGLDVMIDGIGNVIGLAAATGPRIMTGSHLESQNHAGWLDGPLGMVYALEAVRAITEAGGSGAVAIDVGAFADEEGHFGSLVGSRSFVGDVEEAEIDVARDMTRGTPMRDALAAAGLAGKARFTPDLSHYRAYLEAHIEQGDWLEAQRLSLGVVTSIVAIWQYRIVADGVQNHAGTTRMAIRKDAGAALMRLATTLHDAFPAVAGERAVWTIGRIVLEPGQVSIIPGRAEMVFQMRSDDTDRLSRMEQCLTEHVAAADLGGPCRVRLEPMRKGVPATMDTGIQAAFESAAQRHAPGRHVRMPSGAIHDAQSFARHMPSGMLFVPSIGGISHHWTEDTSVDDIVLGARVFTDAVALVAAGLA